MSIAEATIREQVGYYLSLPYRVELIPDLEEDGYAVSIPDLPGCISQGCTGRCPKRLRPKGLVSISLWQQRSRALSGGRRPANRNGG